MGRPAAVIGSKIFASGPETDAAPPSRPTEPPNAQTFPLFPAVLTTLALLVGCSEEEPAEVDIYRVRGVVKSLPEAGNPTSSLMVHHEAIPTFIGHDGKTAPMAEMTMPFPTAAGVSIEELKVGDKVELRMEVTRGEGYQATEITPLAGDLELKLNGNASADGACGRPRRPRSHGPQPRLPLIRGGRAAFLVSPRRRVHTDPLPARRTRPRVFDAPPSL